VPRRNECQGALTVLSDDWQQPAKLDSHGPPMALLKNPKLLFVDRLTFGGAAVAYLASLFVLLHYHLPFKNGVVTAGYIVVRLQSKHGSTTVLFKPWQADLFHFLEILALACLLPCVGIWYYDRKRSD
jgi:hypothetical protein